MPRFGIDASGGLDDTLRIVVGGKDLAIVKSYEFASSVLEVPSSFALRIGHAGVVSDLLKLCPPHAEYKVYVRDILQASGRLDGFSVPSDEGSTVELRGRDLLAPLHDAFIREEVSYASKTYLELVQTALKGAGVEYSGKIVHSNASNRKQITGVDVKAQERVNVEEIVVEKGKGGVVYKTVVAKLSERWGDFVRTHLDRAGLFLWAAANGDVILSAPNTDQEPTYELVHDPAFRESQRRFFGGVRRDEYRDGVEPPRYSEAVVYSRTAAKKFGRGKVKGGFVDQGMIDLGIDRPLTMRDANVASIEQAERLAARKLAEGRRATFALRYTTHGHSAASRVGGGRAVWAPDTIVALDDREIGLKGNFWVESVAFRGSESSGRTTTLRLMRPDDVIFGHEDDEAA